MMMMISLWPLNDLRVITSRTEESQENPGMISYDWFFIFASVRKDATYKQFTDGARLIKHLRVHVNYDLIVSHLKAWWEL